ncbi:MAG: NAD(P)H-hydrate dehydratase [Phycisphaerales bacterium]
MPSASDPPLPPLPSRDPTGHKGTFGTVAVVGGNATADARMIGAPALCAAAALRAGAGLVRLVTPEPILSAALTLIPSATGRGLAVHTAGEHSHDLIPHEAAAVLDDLLRECDAMVIGPGLGHASGAQAATLRALQNERVPVVADADALNCLALIPEFTRELRAHAILTPHPGEFRRLCDSMGLPGHLGLAADRASACQQLAQRLGGCVIVLKGAGTVVSDGARTWTHQFADSVLATAGTGDVLSGIIAALVSQFVPRRSDAQAAIDSLSGVPADVLQRMRQAVSARDAANDPASRSPALSLFDAARLGVVVHARAAQHWRHAHHDADAGLLALELASCIPHAMRSLRRPHP